MAHEARGSGYQVALSGCSSQIESTHVAAQLVGDHPRLPAVVLDLSTILAEGGESSEGKSPEKAPMNVILVCDVSGSMSHVIPQVRETVRQVGAALSKNDQIGVITFDHEYIVDLELGPCDISTVLSVANGIHCRGGTNISDALLEAIDMATRHEHTSQNRITHVYLLSDGCPYYGITDIPALRITLKEKFKNVQSQVVMNSFGFTTAHDADYLQAATSCGNSSNGAYYYLATDNDIGACVGDCLGSVANVVARYIKISAICVEQSGETSANWACCRYVGWNDRSDVEMKDEDRGVIQSSVLGEVGFLSMDERHAVVIICHRTGEVQGEVTDPMVVKLSVQYTHGITDEKKICFLDCQFPANPIPEKLELGADVDDMEDEDDLPELEPKDLPHLERNPEKGEAKEDMEVKNFSDEGLKTTEEELTYLHIMTHITRINAAYAFQRSTDIGIDHSLNLKSLEELHHYVLELLQKISVANAPDSRVVQDEGILMAIERDLGEILEKIHEFSENHTVGRGVGAVRYEMPASLRMRLLQVAQEHEIQRSAVGASQLSKISPYSTSKQLAMRLRFLTASASSGDPLAKKAVVDFSDDLDGCAPSEKEVFLVSRKKFEEEATCYVSCEGWRGCQLGIGLLVKPRTARERYRGLVPVLEIIPDYLSSEAYNAGVRVQVKTVGNTSEEFKQLDREDQQTAQGKPEGVGHKTITSSVRGRINAWLPLYINKTNWEFAKVWAPSAFSIIATQFNDQFKPEHALQVCAKLMIQTCVSCVLTKGNISEKQIQMYCDVHRLFLEMMVEYPNMAALAQEQIRKFIENPVARKRRNQPDLGCLINYMTITQAYTWDQLKEIYVQEAFRRNARHIGHVNLPEIQTVDRILEMWEEKTNAGKVTMFNVMFLNTIARPEGKMIHDIKKTYDQRWGLVEQDKIDQIMAGFQDIFRARTMPEILRKLGIELEKEAIAELILWAFENKEEPQGRDAAPKYEDGLPKSGGQRLEEWKYRSQLWKLVQENPPPVLEFKPPVMTHKPKASSLTGLTSAKTFLSNMEQDRKQDCVVVECSCKRCQYEQSLLERARERVGELAKKTDKQTAGRTLFVGKLKFSTNEAAISGYFGVYGEVKSVNIIKNRKGKSRGYAFVEFLNSETLVSVFQRDNFSIDHTIDGVVVVVDRVKGFDADFKPNWVKKVHARHRIS